METLDDFIREQAMNPAWEKAGKVHDWRNHVPDHIRSIWDTFNGDQKLALLLWADELASREEWD